jgi:cysteine desulfurase
VANLIGAAPEEIVFTASGSEANNLALKGVMAGAEPGRRRMVVSTIEHPSVLEAARQLESRGTPVTWIPVGSDGVLDVARLEAALGPDVALVSVMLANNETGVLQPVAEIAAAVRACGARFHTDAVQAAGKLPVDVGTLGVDLLTLAGHKFHGPPGAAALYVRRRTRLVPLVHGGHQERGRRAGTENLAAVVGLGVAAELAADGVRRGVPRTWAAAGEELLDGLERLPGTRLHGHRTQRLGSIVNVGFASVDGEAVLHELDLEGITVSTGSACSAASPGPSHVLLAMGLSAPKAHTSVRFSLGAGNDVNDVARILDTVPPILARLRALGGILERPESSGSSADR